jgi:hypothetical protein
MKTIVIAVAVLLASLFKCSRTEKTTEYVPMGCDVVASVVDLRAGREASGLDGCGLMLELEDGSRLNPEKRVYIQAPKQEEDPLYYFTLTAGEKVKISYKETSRMDACMAGKTVFITCITKID